MIGGVLADHRNLGAAAGTSTGGDQATDASAEDNVTAIATFPADSHPAIVYPLARLAGRDGTGVAALVAYLQGDEARAAFVRQGFAVLGD